VELSNAQGTFEQPMVIGSLTTTDTQGTIGCLVPDDLVPGPAYQVRVTTSSPFYSPVPVALPLLLATGLAEAVVRDARVWVADGMLRCDLRASTWNDAFLEVFDSSGRAVHRGGLAARTLQDIGPISQGGVALIRITHRDGVWSGRVVLP
jgi:hypothetical protein